MSRLQVCKTSGDVPGEHPSVAMSQMSPCLVERGNRMSHPTQSTLEMLYFVEFEPKLVYF